MSPDAELPVWERDDAFPPAGPGWGWVDRRGGRHECPSFEELTEAIVKDAGARVDLVWTPESKGCVLPEEVRGLFPAMREARVRWALWDIEEGKRQMRVFGLVIGVLALWQLLRNGFRPIGLLSNGTLGLTLLLFFILGFFPWYKGRKRLKTARAWAAEEMAADARAFRFEIWLDQQRTPVTRLMFGLLAMVGLVQLFVEVRTFNLAHGLKGIEWLSGLKEFFFRGFDETIKSAGLTKKLDGKPADWWRLFTAPFLHGHWVHWAMNASALGYLGKRVEVFARWPHLVMAYLISAWVGGETSARFTKATSVGASGGLMGLLGFLLVFESLHRRLVPESSRRRLVAGVVVTLGIGLVFSHFIDNAAHLGGLVAGMVYAALVFPKSSSPHRPGTTMSDVLFGGAAIGVLVCAALMACGKML
ncbi:rhomboid family intramembrane serine protease [Haloferula sp. BvORR071]|uniref:rhomboid family intramembrane serine protease n=1 Tax=Haloferula sp. BvORR071 TaxID=1396141 RepID=UPI000697ED98|nr:rhomboid family intramembrane serine protease [Haloferula sp. BvORR071]